jgi:hypothetical protein
VVLLQVDVEEDWSSWIWHRPQHTEHHLQSDAFLRWILLQSVAGVHRHSQDVHYISCEEGENPFMLKSLRTAGNILCMRDLRFINWLTVWSRVLLGKLRVVQLVKKFPAFYRTQGSLLCSQEYTSGPYFEQDEPSSNPPTLFLYDSF